jgi:AcrR family transcriptional regulator
LATEANVSVGLIYKYFGGKEDLLLATILRIQDAFRDQLSPVIEAAGGDPVEQLVAGIRRYIQIVDENLDAVVLTYRGRCIYCGRIEFARRRILRRSTEARPHRGNRSRRANAAPR